MEKFSYEVLKDIIEAVEKNPGMDSSCGSMYVMGYISARFHIMQEVFKIYENNRDK